MRGYIKDKQTLINTNHVKFCKVSNDMLYVTIQNNKGIEWTHKLSLPIETDDPQVQPLIDELEAQARERAFAQELQDTFAKGG